MSYHHLTEGERYQIQLLASEGYGPTVIGQRVGRCKSVISRELRRNRSASGRYRASEAQRAYRKRLRAKGRSRQPWHRLFDEFGVPLLQEGWSPAQISGVCSQDPALAVSHEWLYQRILRDKAAGGTLYRFLRCQKVRKKRYGRPERRGQLSGRRSIHDRPGVVAERQRIGDWEADTIIGTGHRGAVVSLVERASGFSKLVRVPTREAKTVTTAIVEALRPYRNRVLTITFDNGKEFAGHQEVARQLQADCFFADPYSSWQRGCNEHLNGLVRQYFPKGKTDFTKVTQAELDEVERKLNHRPRKRLGWHSPAKVFHGGKPLN